MTNEVIIGHTKKWIANVVIGLNFCPFAAKSFVKNNIRYYVLHNSDIETALYCLMSELQILDSDDEVETSFIILYDCFDDFEDYLGLVYRAEELLQLEGYEGVYQIASFHPDYVFGESDENDPANFTNRSPYPMLHLLREESLEKAISLYENPEEIPENNVKLARQKGLAYMEALRKSCFQ